MLVLSLHRFMLVADCGGGAGIRVDLQHGSPPSRCTSAEALKAIDKVYNGPPDRVPTMLRDPDKAEADRHCCVGWCETSAQHGEAQPAHWPTY